ncbi:TPA: hypothetical protein P0E12_002306 [Vibrio harveyi]|nr:hypothetical protein [Vibrio harveyi]
MKKIMIKSTIILLMTLIVAACTSTDEVVFVTKSSLSIVDIDSTPAEITLGYDRVEGYFAPGYSNGALPPVISSIRTDGGLLAPEIQQLYATGEAANIVTDSTNKRSVIEKTLEGDKKGMFFGTSTNLGFKVGVTQDKPSLIIGYKRMEASYIPLGTVNGVDAYPSVIASIDTTINTPTNSNPDGLQVGQFFATGLAAEQLASKKYIKQGFDEKAKEAIDRYNEELGKQQISALHTLKCAASLNDEQWAHVVDAASTSNLLSGVGSEVEKRWQRYIEDKTVENRQSATKLYFSAISKLDGASPTYAAVLESHRSLVCKLAGEANNA